MRYSKPIKVNSIKVDPLFQRKHVFLNACYSYCKYSELSKVNRLLFICQVFKKIGFKIKLISDLYINPRFVYIGNYSVTVMTFSGKGDLRRAEFKGWISTTHILGANIYSY